MNTNTERSQLREERAQEIPSGETRHVRTKPDRAHRESAQELSSRRAAEARSFVEAYLKTHEDLNSLIEQLEVEIDRLETYLRTKATDQVRKDIKMARAKLEFAKRRQTQIPQGPKTQYEKKWTPDRLAQRDDDRAREAQRAADAALIRLQHEVELTEMRLRDVEHKLENAKARGTWFLPKMLLEREIRRIKVRQRELQTLVKIGQARQEKDNASQAV